MTGATPLEALRRELKRRELDGFIVPHVDAFRGEYIPPNAERLAWLTGFSGSAGTAVVTMDDAAVFVDGRYTLQVATEVDTEQFQIRHLIDEPQTGWITGTLKAGGRIGYDAWLHSINDVKKLSEAAQAADGELVAVEGNPIDAVWTDQPAPPLAPIVAHAIEYTGLESTDKRRTLSEAMIVDEVNAVVLSASDSIAWLLNVRGSDVEFSPLPLAFAILHDDAKVDYFLHPDKVSSDLKSHMGEDVSIHDPDTFGTVLDNLAKAGKTVAVDAATAPVWISHRLRDGGIEPINRSDPCQLPKAIKNEVELKGMRTAHRRDGAALTTFLAWLSREAVGGDITEISAADHLEGLRARSDMFRGLSFPTISGAGANGAIVHYRVDDDSNRKLESGSLYLVDSGAQYPDGTTDVTRTVAIGTPTDEMRDRFTRVLKGHIAIARSRFGPDTPGSSLDRRARMALAEIGLDYDHGTGHGVGCYLNVHEGPQRISKQANQVALRPGMVISNEPGYYKSGAYGIRIENLVVVVADADDDMLGFETLTLAPIDRTLIDVSLLDREEIDWINAYHSRVRGTLTPLIDDQTADWLAKSTVPLD